MKRELIMDVSKEIFKLDREDLHFIINASTISKLSSVISHSSHFKPLSQTEVTATNLTSEYIAFRVKTNKKEYYAVDPTYTILTPNGKHTFQITYYNKPEKKIDSKEHKFRFEGFIIPEEKKNDPVKDIFQDYIKKEIKVSGNSIKLISKFTLEENIGEENLNFENKIEPKKEDEKEILRNSMISSASEYTIPDVQKSITEENNSVRLSDLIINKDTKVEMSDKERLENLKKEYNKLKEEVDNLKMNEELLNKKKRNERNKKNIVPESEKFRFNLPEIKDKPFSRNILIGIFAFSALIGFYLIK